MTRRDLPDTQVLRRSATPGFAAVSPARLAEIVLQCADEIDALRAALTEAMTPDVKGDAKLAGNSQENLSGVPDPDGLTTGRWRIGRTYNLHVYQGDLPVATFHRPADARRCVDAVNDPHAMHPSEGPYYR